LSISPFALLTANFSIIILIVRVFPKKDKENKDLPLIEKVWLLGGKI
jgi:hypothetical protein